MTTPYPSRMLLAIQTTLYIAYHSIGDAPVKSVQIIERYGLNRRALEPILQTLTREGVLESRQGANGGYMLVNPKENLGRIARLFMEPVKDDDLIFNDFVPVIIPHLHAATETMLASLDGITVQQCCATAENAGITRGGGFPLDFII